MFVHSPLHLNLISPTQFYYKPSSELVVGHHSCSSKRKSPQPDCTNCLSPQTNQSVAAIVFGDGSPLSDSGLYPLTKRRSEGAVPIAGNYRLIDAVISNCINSDITKIYALTQYNSTSLNSHITRAYSGSRLSKDGFVEVIAAYQTTEDNNWFQGTADAIRKCLWVLEEYPVREFLVLPGHHLYKMDYRKLIDAHRKTKEDITISVFGPKKDENFGFGICKVNADNRVLEFSENTEMSILNSIRVQNMVSFDGKQTCKFPSMGIYVINRSIMVKLLKEYFPIANGLKCEVIPGAISLGMKVYAYKFEGYWEDMRSIGAYYRANMEIIHKTNEEYNIYDRDFPLYTSPRHLPPTLVKNAVITDSVIGDGCILNKCMIKGSVLGMRTRVGNGAFIEDSVVMGSDTYIQSGMGIAIGIGEGSVIKKAIIDKNARIGKNVRVMNKDNVQEGDMEKYGYIIREGIVVIIRSAEIPDGSIV